MSRPALPLALAAVLALSCFKAEPCPQLLSSCGGMCVDLSSDVLNCGTCGDACTAGRVCVNGSCVTSDASPCALRTGGAFVTFGALPPCQPASVKVWVENPSFVTRAEELAANPSSPGLSVPFLDLRTGTDCDAEWSWHAGASTPSWQSGAVPECDRCPDYIEGTVLTYLADVGRWCPSPTTARVLLVDPR